MTRPRWLFERRLVVAETIRFDPEKIELVAPLSMREWMRGRELEILWRRSRWDQFVQWLRRIRAWGDLA